MPGRRLTALGCRVNALRGLRGGAVVLASVAAMWSLPGLLPAVAATTGVAVSSAPFQPDSGSLAILAGADIAFKLPSP